MVRETRNERGEGPGVHGFPPRAGLAALLTFVMIAGACAAPPEVHYYDIRLPDPTPAQRIAGKGTGSVAVESVVVPDYLDLPEIFYRKSAFEAGYYAYRRWVRPLSQSLAAELARYLRRSGRFAAVAGPGEDLPGAATVSIEVLSFNENDGERGKWTARAVFLVMIERPGSASPRRTLVERTVPIERRCASGAVQALNGAFAGIAADILAMVAPPKEAGMKPR